MTAMTREQIREDLKMDRLPSMAQLGRDAKLAIVQVTGDRYLTHYVNKTEKYVSIKVEGIHLEPKQIEEVSAILRNQHPDRFLRVANGTATCYGHGVSWKEPKVMVRFTQEF